MKKAKVMLAAVAVFAVVGGSLAFKAARFNDFKLYYSTANPITTKTASCTLVATSQFTITTPVSPVTITPSTFYSSTTGLCPTTTVYEAE